MIVISRKTGELLHADPLTQQQREDMAFAVFKAFCEMNPELVREELEKIINENN